VPVSWFASEYGKAYPKGKVQVVRRFVYDGDDVIMLALTHGLNTSSLVYEWCLRDEFYWLCSPSLSRRTHPIAAA